ncbi:unnamed protein product, partial [Heterosigma akashiwo]
MPVTASEVRFTDDIHVHSSRPVLNPEDIVGADFSKGKSGDVFLVSRMNDESSYFYTWFCKRFEFKLKANKTYKENCPICLESELHSIELQCGHSFCRGCLTHSAEMKISCCPLCRANICLNPEVLRKNFEDQRIRNLMRRFQNVDRQKSFSSLSFLSTEEEKDHVDPVEQWRQMPLICPAPRPSSSSAEKKYLKKLPSPVIWSGKTSPAKPALRNASHISLDDPAFTRDVGALDASDLQELFSASLAFLDQMGAAKRKGEVRPPDAGACSVVDLSARWAAAHADPSVGMLPQLKLSHRLTTARSCRRSTGRGSKTPTPPCAPLPDSWAPDVGASGTSELSTRWANLSNAARSPEAGDLSIPQLHERWCAALGSPDVGSTAVEGLRTTWKTITSVGSLLQSDTGAKPSQSLKKRWGALADQSEMRTQASHCLSPTSKLAPLVKDPGHFDLATLCSLLDEDVGELSQTDLQTRWADLTTLALDTNVFVLPECVKARGDLSAGGLPLRDLKARWFQPSMLSKYGDCGGSSVPELAARWDEADESIGAEPQTELAGRWAALAAQASSRASPAPELAAPTSSPPAGAPKPPCRLPSRSAGPRSA